MTGPADQANAQSAPAPPARLGGPVQRSVLLQVDDLHVHYGGIRALQGVSLQVYDGQIVTLIGCNGAGKTTLLRAISRLVSIRSGRIAWTPSKAQGQEPQKPTQLERLAAHEVVRLGISHCPEGRGVFGDMSVLENLQMGCYLRRDHEQIRTDLDHVMTLFPRLAERRRQLAGTLSGGEQQMLAIARALLSRPRLLMLDEPSLGLAPQLVQQIFRTIEKINGEGVTLLLVEQNAHMALAVAEYAYVLETGRIVLEGPASELARNDSVRKAYLGED